MQCSNRIGWLVLIFSLLAGGCESLPQTRPHDASSGGWSQKSAPPPERRYPQWPEDW